MNNNSITTKITQILQTILYRIATQMLQRILYQIATQILQTILYRIATWATMYTPQQNSPTTHIVAPNVNPKALCASCSTVMPSDICFNCGTLSKFLAAYPELETSVIANQEGAGPTITGSTNFKKAYTRNRREHKLDHRANDLLMKTNALNWQFNLDGGLRDIELRDIGLLNASELLARYGTESQESFGIEAEDVQIPYDIWRDLAQEESAPLDDDLNLHYLGHNLLEELNMAADHEFQNADDRDEYANDADDEDSEFGDAQGSDGNSFPSNKLVEMARRCATMTMQWEASLPAERISRKAQALYNDLCEWNFTDATSCAISGATLVEDDELSPLTSARKFSFEYELDSMDWDGNSSCSSSATVRNQLIECRHIVGGQAYQWDILFSQCGFF